MDNISKNCNKCNINKPLSEFHKNKGGKYGVHSTCKECKLKYKSKYRIENRDEINRKQKIYEINNHDKISKYKAQYYKDNKEAFNIRQKEYNRKYPHIKGWRDLLYSSLKRMGKTKEGHTIDLLGYSAIELKEHIESLFTDGMTWDNHGEWHIDHIKPITSFNQNTPPNIVNSLSNLRPLWATTREINGIIYEGNLNRPKFY